MKITGHSVQRLAIPLLVVSVLLQAPIVGAQDSQTSGNSQTATSTPATDKAAPAAAPDKDSPFPQRFKVSDGILDGGAEWFNTSQDISIKDLRGKIVLIDFWTYCCINCIHVLPDLKYLEKKYEKEIVVIGVHSAKFDNEKVSENIRQAIMRYEIAHPVVNDSEMTIWRNFRTSSWPTLALIDPEGYFIGRESGEGNREIFDQVIAKLVEHHRAKGTLNEEPFRPVLESAAEKPTALRYPGKVLVDETGKRLFVADSNHNRIVIAGLDGTLQDVIGTGRQGIQDGAWAEATFNHPQGMELVGDLLYVADTENHAIRTVNLTAKTVSTLAGTGEQSRLRIPRGNPNSIQLNSPWALKHLDGTLYIAMAGPHQLWSHKLGSQLISVYAGSGREDILNGPLAAAALAQPSGIASDGESLYVVDSEGSAVRKIGTGANATVETIVGQSELPRGQSLFSFGDVDGIGDAARLQHPLGIVCRKDTLYVADSYNHKIKRVNLSDQSTATWVGTGKPGRSLDPPQLSEPGGIGLSSTELFVADTNNHRICAVNLETGAMREFVINGLTAPRSTAVKSSEQIHRNSGELLPAQKLAVNAAVVVKARLHYPEGFKPNTLAPIIWKISTADDQQKLIPSDIPEKRREAELEDGVAMFKIPLTETAGQLEIQLQLTYQYCLKARESVCKNRSVRLRIPLHVADSHSDKTIEFDVPPEPGKQKTDAKPDTPTSDAAANPAK